MRGCLEGNHRIGEMLAWMDSALASRWFWLGVLAFRLWNALFVRTTFNPDEYWQSTEVAHRMVFGYGHLTWEWQDDARLRGYAHPALFALLYKTLAMLGLDTRWAVAYAPRLLQGCVAALNDFFVHKMALSYFDRTAARWALFCSLLSWFTFYVMVRPYSNSIETMCTSAALAHWPWAFLQGNKKQDDAVESIATRRRKALSWAAVGVLFRPTNAVLWIFLGGVHFYQSRDRIRLVVAYVLPIAAITLSTMMLIDRVGYGDWTFVPLNFFKFNVLEGNGKLYGEHPFSWYFAQAFPANIGTVMPLFLAGLLTAPPAKKELGGVIMFSMLVFSMSAHKEFRFILPLLPPALVYAGYCLRNLEKGLYVQVPQNSQRTVLRIAVFIIVVPNLFASMYLSRWHQRAPIEVMDFLADRIQETPNASIHFWTPCHTTPYYSFLHQNVSMWFPDCSPVNRLRPEGSDSQQLQREPAVFLPTKYAFPHILTETTGRETLPTFVVLFSNTATRVERLLARAEYEKVASFPHSQVSGDADEAEASHEMLVYHRTMTSAKTNGE